MLGTSSLVSTPVPRDTIDIGVPRMLLIVTLPRRGVEL
jgi:hypothetical protein